MLICPISRGFIVKLMYRGRAYKTSLIEKSLEIVQPSRRVNSTLADNKVQLRRPSSELIYRGVRYTR